MTPQDYEVLGTVIARAVLAATAPLRAKVAALEQQAAARDGRGPEASTLEEDRLHTLVARAQEVIP